MSEANPRSEYGSENTENANKPITIASVAEGIHEWNAKDREDKAVSNSNTNTETPTFWEYLRADIADSAILNRLRSWMVLSSDALRSARTSVQWFGNKAQIPNEDPDFKVTEDMVAGYEDFPSLMLAGNKQQFDQMKALADETIRRRKVKAAYPSVTGKIAASLINPEEWALTMTGFGVAEKALKAARVTGKLWRPAEEAVKFAAGGAATNALEEVIEPNPDTTGANLSVGQRVTGDAVFGAIVGSMPMVARVINKGTTKRLKEASDAIADGLNHVDVEQANAVVTESVNEAFSKLPADTIASDMGVTKAIKSTGVHTIDQDMMSSIYPTARATAEKGYSLSFRLENAGQTVAQVPPVEALINKTANMRIEEFNTQVMDLFKSYLEEDCGYSWCKAKMINWKSSNICGGPQYEEFSRRVENVIITGTQDVSDRVNRCAEIYRASLDKTTQDGIDAGVYSMKHIDEAVARHKAANNEQLLKLKEEAKQLNQSEIARGNQISKEVFEAEQETAGLKQLLETAEQDIKAGEEAIRESEAKLKDLLTNKAEEKAILNARKELKFKEEALEHTKTAAEGVRTKYTAAEQAYKDADKRFNQYLKETGQDVDSFLGLQAEYVKALQENAHRSAIYNESNRLWGLLAERRKTPADFPKSKDVGYVPRRYDAAYILRHPEEAKQVIKDAYAKQGKEISDEKVDEIIGKIRGYQNPYKNFSTIRQMEHERTMDVATEDLDKILIHDIIQTHAVFTKTIVSDSEVRKAFGTLNAEDVIQRLKQERVSLVYALDKKGLKGREYRKEYNKINDEFERQAENIRTTFDRLRGRGSATPTWARVAMCLNTMRSMGMIATAPLMDAFTIAVHQGFKNPLKYLARVCFDKIHFTKHEASMAVKVLDPESINRIVHMDGLIDGNIISQRLRLATNQFMRLTGGPQIDGMLRRFNGAVAEQRILENCAKRGKLSLEESKWMLDVGINEEQMKLIGEQFKAHGQKSKFGRWESGYSKWDSSAKEAFDAAIYKIQYESVLTPTAGARARWMDKTYAGLTFQFMQCMFAAGSKATVPFMQKLVDERGAYILGALSFGFSASYLRQRAKDTLGGVERPQEERIKKAFEEMDLFAQAIFLFDIVSRAKLGEGERFYTAFPNLTNKRPIRKTAFNFAADSLSRFAPVSLANDLAKATIGMAQEKANYSNLHAVRRLIPANNLAYFCRLFNAMEQSIGQSLDIPRYFDTVEEQKAAQKRHKARYSTKPEVKTPVRRKQATKAPVRRKAPAKPTNSGTVQSIDLSKLTK